MRCLEETCNKEYVLHVNIDEFAEHMQRNHEKICEIKNGQCSLPDHDTSNWIYFMHREQGAIECLVCETIVTDKPTDTLANNHMLYGELDNSDWNKRFDIIRKNWIWKYQKQTSEYIVKCRLCGEDLTEIHLTPDTTTLQKHYNLTHESKWKEIEYILRQEQIHKQARPPHKLQKTS